MLFASLTPGDARGYHSPKALKDSTQSLGVCPDDISPSRPQRVVPDPPL